MPASIKRLQLLPRSCFVWRRKHLPVVRYTLVDFDDGRREHGRLANRQIKQPRPGLVADFQHIAKSARGDERRPRSAARR